MTRPTSCPIAAVMLAMRCLLSAAAAVSAGAFATAPATATLSKPALLRHASAPKAFSHAAGVRGSDWRRGAVGVQALLLSGEAKSLLKDIFNAADSDSSGYLSLDEYAKMVEKVGDIGTAQSQVTAQVLASRERDDMPLGNVKLPSQESPKSQASYTNTHAQTHLSLSPSLPLPHSRSHTQSLPPSPSLALLQTHSGTFTHSLTHSLTLPFWQLDAALGQVGLTGTKFVQQYDTLITNIFKACDTNQYQILNPQT